MYLSIFIFLACILNTINIRSYASVEGSPQQALSENEVNQLKQLLQKAEKSTEQKGKVAPQNEEKMRENDNKNWKILNKFIENNKSDQNDETNQIYAIRQQGQTITYIQELLELFNDVYGFTIGSIDKLSKQYTNLLENLMRRICICHLFKIFITNISSMISSFPQTTTISVEQINNILQLLLVSMQKNGQEIDQKALANTFQQLRSISTNTYPLWPSTLMFSIINVFKILLEGNLQNDLNDFKAANQLVSLELKETIDKLNSEKISDKFSTDRKNVTSCLIILMQNKQRELTQFSKELSDLARQIIRISEKIQKECSSIPKQDVTPFIGREKEDIDDTKVLEQDLIPFIDSEKKGHE